MSPVYKEASFPADYREAEVRQIMNTLYRRRSIAITGLAGMGKSNVVRFLVSHPQVQSRYLGERAGNYAFLHVDCAGLAHNSEDEILGEIAAQLHYQGLATSTVDLPDPLRTLRRSLKAQILALAPKLDLVLVMDYFDEAAVALDSAFFNYLFHLRNARPQGNLAYIFVTRRPMGHLHELNELLDESCFVGPLNRKDALDSLRRDEARLNITFSPAQREQLIACTGGHPGFLKNSSELLHSGAIDASLPTTEIAQQLLQADTIKTLCQELWDDLTSEKQAILLKVAAGTPLQKTASAEAQAHVTYLEKCGLLVRRKKEHAPGSQSREIFCPLFEAFVRALSSAVSSRVRITPILPNQARIETPTHTESVMLSPKLFALLLALTEARERPLSTDALIAHVYPGEAEGVTDAALSQLVKRLRAALNPHMHRITGNPTYDCVETIRDVGYKLNG